MEMSKNIKSSLTTFQFYLMFCKKDLHGCTVQNLDTCMSSTLNQHVSFSVLHTGSRLHFPPLPLFHLDSSLYIIPNMAFYTQMSVRDLLGQETLQLLCQCTHWKYCQIWLLKANAINQTTWVLICNQKMCLGKNINETSILDVTKQHIKCHFRQ